MDEMVGLNGHEFEQTLGDSKGQGSLVCCSPWDHKELDMPKRLNNNINGITADTNLFTYLSLHSITYDATHCLVFLTLCIMCLIHSLSWIIH